MAEGRASSSGPIQPRARPLTRPGETIMRPPAALRGSAASASDPSSRTSVAADSRPASERGALAINESTNHVQEGPGVEAAKARGKTSARGGNQGAAPHQGAGSFSAAEETEAQALTVAEKKAFLMGVLRGVEVAADFVRVKDKALAERIELCRIAIAARSVDVRAPAFWPQRGGT